MIKQLAIFTLVLAIVGCEKPPTQSSAAPTSPVIEGEVNEASYDKTAKEALTQAMSVISDAKSTEQQIDAQVSKIESVISLAEKADVDKEHLNEPKLVSTLGSLYVRKAAFYTNNVRDAGTLTAKGFRYLDKAVTTYPQNITARINRGMVSAKVPSFMNKSEVARDDLQFVLNSAEFEKLAPPLQNRIKVTLAEVNARLTQDEK